MRFGLFGVTAMAGRTDAADDDALARLLAEWADVAFILEGHHGHEDQFCDPLVQDHAPGLRDELEVAHRESDAAIAAISAAARALAGSSPGGQRWLLLRAFHLDLADFTAAYIGHLRFEEDRVMPALNAAMSDSALADLTNAIRMSVPPAEMCTFIRYMVPAMNPSERVDMLGGMYAGAPAEVFEMFRAAAQNCLDPADYRALAAAAGFG
jgi:hypothetical protein